DRVSGRFLSGTPFVSRVNWASGLSPEGRPILTFGHEPSVEGSHTCPSTAGGYLESPKPEEAWQLYVRALDGTTGRKIWDYQQISSFHYGPGVLSTAG